VDDGPVTPSVVKVKLSASQEAMLATFTTRWSGVDGTRRILRQLREGQMDSAELSQLVDSIKATDAAGNLDLPKGKLAVLRRAVTAMESQLGVPGAMKTRNTDLAAELRANNDQAAEIRRKAMEDGC
jgi:hypothetical protein